MNKSKNFSSKVEKLVFYLNLASVIIVAALLLRILLGHLFPGNSSDEGVALGWIALTGLLLWPTTVPSLLSPIYIMRIVKNFSAARTSRTFQIFKIFVYLFSLYVLFNIVSGFAFLPTFH
jgi:hypothetical protein